MNTHEILKTYHGASNYPAIAQYAARAYAADRSLTAANILAMVETKFGPMIKIEMGKAAPFEIFGRHLIERGAIDQMRMVMELPVAVRGALMPDGHPGYAMPIGGVAALDNAVSPNLVGFDISCMVMLTVFEVGAHDFMQNRSKLARDLQLETSFGLGAAFDKPRTHPVMEDDRWNTVRPAKALKPLAASQLGSSGGGNHFADLVIVERNAHDPMMGLLTHSGSRGTGHKLATHYGKVATGETAYIARDIPAGYEWLDIRTEAGQEYLAAMELMGAYALANHECIHDAFARRAGLTVHYNIWNRHNYAWVEDGGLVVHRKGATPADEARLGLIPGTSGTPSYLVRGMGNDAALLSSSHGAGRPFSRTEAKRRHDQDFVDSWMVANEILTFGLAADETLLAYKDIEAVMAAQENVLVRTVGRMIPKVVIMGGKSDDGD